jgi:putative ABC transport system permease protein
VTPRELWLRMKGAFGLGPPDRELEEELAFHRDMLEESYRARGLDAGAARRAARLAFGSETQLAEAWRDQRGLVFVDALRQDIRYAIRTLKRSPGFTVAALLTLTLGIGANTAIFTIVNAVLLRPLPYVDPDRLVVAGDRAADGSPSGVGLATMIDFRDRSHSFDQLAMLRLWMPTLLTETDAEQLPAARVSWNYFAVLGVRPALGRDFTAADDREDGWRVVVLSDRLWRRRFGADPAILGRTIALNDQSFRVVGVMPASFEALDSQRYFSTAAEVWAPIGNDQAECRIRCRPILGIGRLRPDVHPDAAAAELNGIRQQLRVERPDDYAAGSVSVVGMLDAVTGRARTALFVLMAAVVFVLLIACANVANLLLARGVARERELALRVALGASRARIYRQLLTESLLLGAGGAAAGLAVAIAGIRSLTSIAPVTLPRLEHAGIDARVLAFTAAVTVATTVLFGVLPAWQGSGRHNGMTVGGRATARGARARAVLVVADLALAVALLTGAGLMMRTVAALTRVDRGFDADRILSFHFALTGRQFDNDAKLVAFQQRAIERLKGLPGVAGVALAGQIPFLRAGAGVGDCWRFHAAGRMQANPADDPCIEHYSVTPDYFRILGIPVLSGQVFTDEDTAASRRVVVVSASTAARVWGGADPIGAQVRLGTSQAWRTVVGVVGDVHADDLTAPIDPAMYTPETQITSAYLTAVVTSANDDPASLGNAVRGALRELDPTVPVYDIATLSSLVDKASAQRAFVARLLTGFAAVAVFLAALGLYGVVSYGVSQRTRELGVRVALGATVSDVVRLVLAGGLRLVAVGVAVGLAAAAASTHLLGALIFGVGPLDPMSFAGAALMLGIVALIAHWVPVRRALRIDPARALRAE